MMKFAATVNKVLGLFNIAIVRRTTFDELSVFRGATAVVPMVDSTLRQCMDKLDAMDRLLHELQADSLRHQISCKWNLVDFMERMNSPDRVEIECPLCGHSDRVDKFCSFESSCIFGGGVLKRHQCPACDLIFGPAKMFALTESELSQDYEWHYRVFSEGDSTEAEIRAFYTLNPKRDGVYLNYGAGSWSKSVPLLREQGWNVLAYEPHASAAINADYVINNREQLECLKYDGIFSNNVLEHLRHPVEDLMYISSLLKFGGKISHATPCFEYLYEYTRFHLYFYLGRSQEVLARRAGLRIEDFSRDGEFMCLRLSKGAA